MKAGYSFISCPGATERQCAVQTFASFFSHISHVVYTFFQKENRLHRACRRKNVNNKGEPFLFSDVSSYNASLRKSLLSNLENILQLENQTRLGAEEFVFQSSVSMTESAPNGIKKKKFVELWLIYNVMFISGVQQDESVIHMHIATLFYTCFVFLFVSLLLANSPRLKTSFTGLSLDPLCPDCLSLAKWSPIFLHLLFQELL